MTQQTQETKDIQQTVSAVLAEAPAQDPPAPPAGGPAAPQPPKTAAKKRKAKKKVRRIIALIVVLALLAAGGWAIWYFLFRNTVEQGEMLTQPVQPGTIQNKAEGSGNAVAKDMSAITCPAGTIQEVFVAAGDNVMEGDPLYTIYSPATEKRVKDAEAALAEAQHAIPNAEDNVADMQDALAQAQEKLAQTPQDNADKVAEAQERVKEAQEQVKEAQEQVQEAQEKLARQPQENAENLAQAQQAVSNAQEALAERQAELAKLEASTADLTVTAPFAGKLASVESIRQGVKLGAESAVATLVNDKVMHLPLYFSTAYRDDFQVGQSADVAVPSMTLTCKGTVAEIHQINMVSPEGGILFEAVIAVPNPGALTENMEATASLKAGDGSDIFPYDTGKLAYSKTEKLTTKLSGTVTAVDLLQYADVVQGQVLLTQAADDLDEQIKAKQREIKTAQEAVETAQKGVPKAQEAGEEALKAAQKAVETAQKGVETAQKAVEDAQKAVPQAQREGEQALKDAQKAVRNAQKNLDQAIQAVEDAQSAIPDAEKALEEAQAALDGLNATAPISGSVTSCTIAPGDELTEAKTVITISNTAQMSVEIKVTEQNIGFITPNQEVELTNWNEEMWIGTVTDINMNPSQDDMGSGGTKYKVTLTVDNYDGSLNNGAELQYSFVTNQVENCLVVPNQAIKSTMDEEGNEVMVVFIQAESRPENAVTMPEQSPDRPKQYPTEEDGFYAVPVTTGANDTYNVEIREGLNAGDVVFVNYLSASGNNWGVMYG